MKRRKQLHFALSDTERNKYPNSVSILTFFRWVILDFSAENLKIEDTLFEETKLGRNREPIVTLSSRKLQCPIEAHKNDKISCITNCSENHPGWTGIRRKHSHVEVEVLAMWGEPNFENDFGEYDKDSKYKRGRGPPSFFSRRAVPVVRFSQTLAIFWNYFHENERFSE